MKYRIFLWIAIFLASLAAPTVAQPIPPPPPCCWPPPCNCNCLTPPPHMVGWWTLDEAGPKYLDRALGNTGTGFNTIALTGTGINGGAVTFDGVGSNISVADGPAVNFGTGDFSVDLWVRTSFNEFSTRTILDKRSNDLRGYHLWLYRGLLGIQIADSAGYTNYGSNLFIATGTWNHVAVTVSRTAHDGIRFYLNGVQGSSTGDPTLHPDSLSNTVPLILGGRSAAFPGANWRGDMDEIELFNRVLQPAEVAAIYGAGSSGKCKCAALKVSPRAWWRFDEPAGSATVVDSGGDPQGPFDGMVLGAQANAAGRVRGDLVFNGSTAAVGVSNAVPLALKFSPGTTGAFSIDAWVKTTAASGPIVTQVSTDPLDRGANGYSFGYSNGRLNFSVQAIDANFNLTFLNVSCSTCTPVDDGKWHLVGVSLSWGISGSLATATLFVDGAPVASATAPLAGSAGGTFRIGSHVRTSRLPDDTYFNGEIDEVELFDRALTQADFASIFAAGSAGKCQPCNLAPREIMACGTPNAPGCPGGEFCDFSSKCGTDTSGGLCAVRPFVCSPVSVPVCGCDKSTYANACEAAARGVSVLHTGPCP